MVLLHFAYDTIILRCIAAELTHMFILPRQSAEVAAQIKEAEKKPPAQVITVKDGITEEAVKMAKDKKAGLSATRGFLVLAEDCASLPQVSQWQCSTVVDSRLWRKIH